MLCVWDGADEYSCFVGIIEKGKTLRLGKHGRREMIWLR